MSNAVTSLCRPVRVPPTRKSVLMCLADYCHDDGRDWHSIAAIMEWTCLGRTAVIEALKGLESEGLISIDRRPGARSTTFVQLQRLAALPENQSATQTGTAGEPVRDANHTSPADGPPPVRLADEPVRLADPKHQEASVKHQKQESGARTRAHHPSPADLLPEVDGQVLNDWLRVRKDKRARTLTETAVTGLQREAAKLGITAQQAIKVCAERGWVSIDATWDSAQRAAAEILGKKPTDRQWGRRPAAPKTFSDTDYSEGLNG